MSAQPASFPGFDRTPYTIDVLPEPFHEWLQLHYLKRLLILCEGTGGPCGRGDELLRGDRSVRSFELIEGISTGAKSRFWWICGRTAQGVFGVPTFVIDGVVFWGHDAFEMVLDYLRDPEQFADEEMRRIDHLPVGVIRPRRTEA